MNLDGPIPGENYTSNTKNYPWHRPPEITDLDKAIETSFKKLTEEDNAVGLLTMLENGVTVAQAASMFVMSGVGSGKWTPDFAVLLVGPVAHVMYLMAKSYGIECDLGISKKPQMVTSAFVNGVSKVTEEKARRLRKTVDITPVLEKSESGGFMGALPSDTSSLQDSMLGAPTEPMDTEDEEIV